MVNGQEFRSLFLGFELSQPIWDCYSNEPPFDASMFVHFRERIGKDLVKYRTKILKPFSWYLYQSGGKTCVGACS